MLSPPAVRMSEGIRQDEQDGGEGKRFDADGPAVPHGSAHTAAD